MFTLIKLAYRNVFRNFRRSVLSFIAVSLGIFYAIVFLGFMEGFDKQSLKSAIDYMTAHLKMYGNGYINEKDILSLDYRIEEYDKLLNDLQKIKEIKSNAPRIIFSGRLNDGIDELVCIGAGIDPELEDDVFMRSESIIEGEYLKSGEEKMLLGSELAELLGVGADDYLTVIARSKYNTIAALDFQIKGIINSGNPEIDNQFFFIPLDIAQNLLEMENEITEISLLLNNIEDVDAVKNLSLERYGLDVETYRDMMKDLLDMMEMKTKANLIIVFVILLMASAGIINTILMSVYERIREIGTMMAIGMKPKNITYLFCIESAFIGLFGSIVGALLGSVVTYYLETHGLSFEMFGLENITTFPISTFYADLTVGMVVLTFCLGIVVSILSGLYPALKASKMVPSEALRKV